MKNLYVISRFNDFFRHSKLPMTEMIRCGSHKFRTDDVWTDDFARWTASRRGYAGVHSIYVYEIVVLPWSFVARNCHGARCEASTTPESTVAQTCSRILHEYLLYRRRSSKSSTYHAILYYKEFELLLHTSLSLIGNKAFHSLIKYITVFYFLLSIHYFKCTKYVRTIFNLCNI